LPAEHAEKRRKESKDMPIVDKSWSDTYKNLGECDGDEDQCLRIAWTLLPMGLDLFDFLHATVPAKPV
jgi:hypothetical protein